MEGGISSFTCFLSIIIPVYNAENYIDRCLQSILEQELDIENYEIIIIDDGSTDKSYQACRQWANLYNNIQVYQQQNQGQGVARNKGIAYAKGKYITFADIDDFFVPHSLHNVCSDLKELNPEILVTRHRAMDRTGVFTEQRISKYIPKNAYSGEFLLLDNYLPAAVWSKFYSNELLQHSQIKFMPGIIHEDVEFNVRLFSISKRVLFSNEIAYSYFWNPLSTDRLLTTEKKIKSLKSDLYIAHSFKQMSRKYDISEKLSDCLLRLSNSMMTSHFLQLIKEAKEYTAEELKDIFSVTKSLNMIPIQGHTKSKKSDIIRIFLSSWWIYTNIIKLKRII